jgi:hypothetical protein
MKPQTPRERILLTLLPTFLVIAVYGWLIYPRQALEQSTQALQAAQAGEPSLTEYVEKELQIKELDREIEQLLEQQAGLEERRQNLMTSRLAGSSDQISTVHSLTNLMAMNRLQLVHEGPLEGKEQASFPPRLTQAARRAFGEEGSSLQPTLWQLKFHGRYHDVLRVVRHLAETDHPAIPIQLRMEEARFDTDIRAWTLVVWI